MPAVSSALHIDPDFVSQTEDFFSRLKPFSGESPAGFKTDFLGIYTDISFIELLNPQTHEREQHAREISTRYPGLETGERYFECGSLLAALHEATESQNFCMVELGGGWGARAVTAHAMVQQIMPEAREFYIIVEAMREHCDWIRKHMQDNGIDSERHSIMHAAIWVDNQPKLFPDCAGILGQSISYDAPTCVADLTPEEAKESLLNIVKTGELGIVDPFQSRGGKQQTRKWSFVSSVTLRDILLPVERLDYIDVDIQGAEEKVIRDGIDLLEERVKRLHIGTHGEDIHAKLTELFDSRGWQVLVQIPPDGEYATEWGNFSTSDGILSVVNNRLANRGDG